MFVGEDFKRYVSKLVDFYNELSCSGMDKFVRLDFDTSLWFTIVVDKREQAPMGPTITVQPGP